MPCGDKILSCIGGESRLISAVGIHDINVAVAATQALKDDLRTIRRPVWENVLSRAARQIRLVLPVNSHDVDLEVSITIAVEHDFCAVRRPGAKRIKSSIICKTGRYGAAGRI